MGALTNKRTDIFPAGPVLVCGRTDKFPAGLIPRRASFFAHSAYRDSKRPSSTEIVIPPSRRSSTIWRAWGWKRSLILARAEQTEISSDPGGCDEVDLALFHGNQGGCQRHFRAGEYSCN